MVILAIPTAVVLVGLFLWSCIFGQDEVFPGDEGEPLYRQRIKVGSPFRARWYAPRWHAWLGIAATLLLIPTVALILSL